MRLPSNVRVLAWVGCAALIPAFSAPAQVSLQFHFGEDEYHRIDSRHPLRGRQYQTMGALAHTLDEIAQDLQRQAYHAARRDPSQARVLASISDFARRTSGFHARMDSYLDSPWDVRREVDDLLRRARAVNQRVVGARLFPGTYELWDNATDVLGRMQQVLRGADVEVPAPRVHREGSGYPAWEHRDLDRNGNGVPDRLEEQAPPPPDRPRVREQGGPDSANISELRRLGRELDQRVADVVPRRGRDSRATEALDRFGADVHRLRQRLDAGPLDPHDLGSAVSRLLDGARRQSDAVRRDAPSFSGDANEWQPIVDLLARMQGLL